jgi:hypothetical protein
MRRAHWPLGSRRVHVEAADPPPSAEMRRHQQEMNLERAAAIRAVMEGRSAAPDVPLIVPECGGPPSAIIPAPYVEHDATKTDRPQARNSTGKFARHKKYSPSIIEV